ncbi:MAG: aminotransferase class IV family protein, partial [Deltaproteobacteria bacterium]|nr:aminotransferase class IV family protein [Deltaproteobacteria bacterium]
IYLTEKSASIGPLEVASSHSNLLMTLSPFQDYPISYYQEGVPVQISKKYFADSGLLSSVKSTNYLKFILAKREAHQNQVFETLLLNPFGLLCEASSSNIFYVKEGVLKTPPLQDGVLPGVLRKQVIELSEREGIPFQEESLQVAHLSQIDEMFLTSSLKEIMPVREIQEVKKFDQVPGELTRRVMKDFRYF